MNAQSVVSPNGRLSADASHGRLTVSYEGRKALELADVPFCGLTFVRKVKDDYRMLEGKRLHCTNEANEYQASVGNNAKMVLRLYDDGVAFRYEYTGLQNQKQPEENTVYVIPEGTKRWFMQWTESYEGYFPMSTTYKVKPRRFSGASVSEDGWQNRWAYPALMEPAEGVFTLVSEANIERNQSGSSLYNDGERYRVVVEPNEVSLTGDWHTPWRVVIIGSLADVVESTLVTDVCEPNQLEDTDWIQPGVVSWIYWAHNHGSNDYNIIKKYVDMAATLGLPYVLIDAEWDEMKDGKTIEDAIAYAHSKGIKPMIWYNNVPTFTKIAASYNAVLPFTRNVIGPMDYTPCERSSGNELQGMALF